MKRYSVYKDSGVEWIAEIPEGWELRKLKWLLKEKLKYGANESAELDDRSLPKYIRITVLLPTLVTPTICSVSEFWVCEL